MPLPVSYTEAQYVGFMLDVLSNVGRALGWDQSTPELHRAAEDALEAYDSTLAEFTAADDLPRLRALGRFLAWRTAEDALAANYDIGMDGQNLRRGQMYDHAAKQRARYEAEAVGSGYLSAAATSGTIRTVTVQRPDPYKVVPAEVREAEFTP